MHWCQADLLHYVLVKVSGRVRVQTGILTGLVCEYGGFQTAARQRNGGRLGLRRVWVNGRTRMSSRHRKSRLRLALSWVAMSSAQSAPYKMSRTAASLSRRVARPRSARNRLQLDRARSDSSYAVHRQSRRREKGAVSQRLLLIFVPPIRPFTVPTISLGSCQCIFCPKTCCENRGQIWKVALFSTGAIEHWKHNRALSEQWSSAYYGK